MISYKMHFLKLLFTSLVTVQVYYLYKFIYSIPLRYEIPETENEYVEIKTLLRGFINNFHGKHTQKHQQRQHLKHRRNGNNTALTYIPSTNLDAVDQS